MSGPADRANRPPDTELFQTKAWFDNLREHGFVDQPISLPLESSSSAGGLSFELMRPQAGGGLAGAFKLLYLSVWTTG